MTTVSVCKRAGSTPYILRSFEHVSDVIRFVDSWRGFHVTIVNGDGQPIDLGTLRRVSRADNPATVESEVSA